MIFYDGFLPYFQTYAYYDIHIQSDANYYTRQQLAQIMFHIERFINCIFYRNWTKIAQFFLLSCHHGLLVEISFKRKAHLYCFCFLIITAFMYFVYELINNPLCTNLQMNKTKNLLNADFLARALSQSSLSVSQLLSDKNGDLRLVHTTPPTIFNLPLSSEALLFRCKARVMDAVY